MSFTVLLINSEKTPPKLLHTINRDPSLVSTGYFTSSKKRKFIMRFLQDKNQESGVIKYVRNAIKLKTGKGLIPTKVRKKMV